MSSSVPPSEDKRAAERIEVSWSVDCETEDTFLFASITNISALGIFVQTNEPLDVGTVIKLRFAAKASKQEPFVMRGHVQWVNKVHAFGDNLNPGMGIRFMDLKPEERERLVEVVRTIAYLRSEPATN